MIEASNYDILDGVSCLEVQGREVLSFSSPDRLASALSPLRSQFSKQSKKLLREVQQYFPPELENRETGPCVLEIGALHFFCRCFLPLGDQGHGLLLWVEIDLLRASEIIQSFQEKNSKPITFWASLANILRLPKHELGLFSMLRIELTEGLPLVVEIEDWLSPFPGLWDLTEQLAAKKICPSETIEQFKQGANSISLEKRLVLENSVRENDIEILTSLACTPDACSVLDSRWQYTLALANEKLGKIRRARDFFQQAARLDHIDAEHGFSRLQAKLTEPFRKRFPDVFQMIKHGERLRALTTLRYVAPEEPLHANAVLSYCLRGSDQVEEGLKACNISLQLDSNQNDVLANKWSFLNRMGRDQDSFDTALFHLSLFPKDLTANMNLIDSLLLGGAEKQALTLAFRYQIFSSQMQLSLKQFFKVYEQIANAALLAEIGPRNGQTTWQELVDIFERVLPRVSGPTAETLAYFGEALVEVERFKDAQQIFDRVLALEPGNGKIVLGYARALARANRENEAEEFLSTVLLDPNRIDSKEDQLFLITLLAEIQRRTGRPEAGLQTFASFEGNLPQLSTEIGPFPALELAECLIACERIHDARNIVLELLPHWPEDKYVADLARVVS